MSIPKVSVIVPVYNAEKYLAECILSLVNQTLDEIEIVCVNNNSTDSSLQILNTLQEKFGSKIIVVEEKNKGVWYARQKGILAARGEYIAFCDSDDIVNCDMLKKMHEQIVLNNSDMCVCAFDRVDERDKRVISREMRQFGNRTIKTDGNELIFPIVNTALWNKLFKRELFDEFISFGTPPRVMEDALLLLSIFPAVKSITFLDEVLYHYYVRAGSAMSYVEPAEIPIVLEDMAITKQWVTRACDTGRFDMTTALMAFIHIGISLPVKMVNSKVDLGREVREIRRILNAEYPQYKQLKWNRLSSFYKKIYWKTIMAVRVFGTPLYPLFLKLYKIVTINLHIEIKW